MWTPNGGKSAEVTVGEWACPAHGFSNHQGQRSKLQEEEIDCRRHHQPKSCHQTSRLHHQNLDFIVQNYITVPPNGKSSIQIRVYIHIYIHIYNIYNLNDIHIYKHITR